MFTGIIEKTGVIESVRHLSGNIVLSVKAGEEYFKDVKIGDSIAIDGMCLTAEKIYNDIAMFTAVKESAEKSISGFYKTGSLVNLEKALFPDKRMGGHLVNGHVDCVGAVDSIVNTGKFMKISASVSGKFGKYLIDNDSIALNGVSLTIKSVYGNSFDLAVIPQTIKDTNLSYLRGGSKINIEINHITKCIYEFNSRSFK